MHRKCIFRNWPIGLFSISASHYPFLGSIFCRYRPIFELRSDLSCHFDDDDDNDNDDDDDDGDAMVLSSRRFFRADWRED